MRHYAYFLAACLALITLVCSCAMEDKADEATPRLRVSQKSLSVVKTGKLKDGTSATFQVAANKGYRISSDAEWLSVDKPEGVGLVDVAVVCQENNSGVERSASLYVTADGGLKDTVLVSQSLFDPNVALPRTFYSEDFSWTEPIAAANNLKDPVGDPDNGYTRMEVTKPAAADAWAACGLIDWYKTAVNPNGDNKINIQNGYLCFNSNNYFNTGVILPVLTDISDDESANATLTFDAVPNIGGKGADNVPLVVEIIAGSGSLSDTADQQSVTVDITKETTWKTLSFGLYGIDATTRIAIHTAAPSGQHYCRWYLDNISVKE